MTKKLRLLLGAFVCIGCASTNMTGVWKDPSAQSAQLKKVLVVALVPRVTSRNNLEEHLAAELRQSGVQVVPSLQLIPAEKDLTKENVKSVVEQNGFDAVLVT